MPELNVSKISEVANFDYSELTNITFSEYYEIIKPLTFFIAGITFYALFIFKFYRSIARRDIIKLDIYRNRESEAFFPILAKVFFYMLENLVLVPIVVFFWFAILTTLLIILSKSSSPDQILTVSISLVAAVRISSYYSENLSQDLAKMIPFALLGIFLVDASFFSIEKSIIVAKQLPSLWKIGVYYLLSVVVLEFVLRIIHGIVTLLTPHLQTEGPNRSRPLGRE